MHDVIVVGAGPAGSYAAYACSSLGLDTLLLEKEKLPRVKACGGATGRIMLSYCGKEILDIVEREGDGTQLFYDFKEIGFLDKKKLFFKREKLDHFITQMAENAGCTVKDRTKVDSVSIAVDGVHLSAGGETHHSQVLIGADGAYSVVRKSIGLAHERRRHYAAIRSEIDTRESDNDTLVGIQTGVRQHTYFFSDLLGFAWLIPNGDCVNIGMGALIEKCVDLKGRFRRFLTHFGLEEDTPAKGHLIPFRPLDKLYSERVLLVGDAGGFVNPWTGCGIDLAVESAKYAADVCKNAFDENNFSEPMMSKFQEIVGLRLRNLRFRSSTIALLDSISPKNVLMTPIGGVFIKHLSKLA